MKQFRNIVAVLLAALMLCTVLPLSAPVYAADNLIVNGDFENGSANWTLHNDSDTVTEVVEDPTGSGRGKVMHTNSTYTTSAGRDDMFYQTVNLEANADYLLSFKVYCYSTASNAAFIVNFYDPTTGNKVSYNTTDVTGLPAYDIESSSAIRVRLNVNANTGKWIDVTVPFNAGQSTSPRILFANYRTGAGQYYFDDVVLTKVGADEPEEPEVPDEPDQPDAPAAPADYNMLKNGDFEQGDANWTKLLSTVDVVTDPTNSGRGNVMMTNENGSQVSLFQQGVKMSANTDYILTYKVYTYASSGTNPGWWVTLGDKTATYSTSAVSCGAVEVKTVDSSSSTRVRFTITSSSLYNKWIDVTIPFNSGNNTNPNILFSNYRANAGQYYFDDVRLVRADGTEEPGVEEPDTPDTPDMPAVPEVAGNLLKNGTFETGDTTGWKTYQSTSAKAEAARTGNYGAYLHGLGSYGALLQQSADVVIGKTYTVKMWIKVVATGVNVMVRDGGENGELVASKWCPVANYADWTELSFVVSPTTNTLFINVCGAGTGAEEIVYMDDFTATEAPLIDNGDFETGDFSGWEKWQSTVITADAAHDGAYGVNIKGSGSYGGMLNRNLPVKSGKSYELSFWYKVNNNGFNFNFQGVQSGTMYASGWYNKVGEWIKVTKTITVEGDTAIKLNFCGSGNGVAEDAYIDSVTFVELKQASNDGFIINGDFEIGSISPWTTYFGGDVAAEAAHSGAFGLKMLGDGGWGGMLYQDFATEVGKTYTVSMWLKTLAGGTNVQIQDVVNSTNITGTWFTTTSWTQKTFEFTATSTKTRINFCGGGNGVAATVYVDDVQVVRLQDPSFDGYIYNGDFEAGSLTKWKTTYGSTALNANAAHTGNYGASIKGPGDWGGGLLTQVINLEAGKTYTFSFWYLPVSNGVNYKVRTTDGATSFDTLYLDSRKVAQWTYHEFTFESGFNTQIEITFSGSGKGDTDEVYVDDFRLVNLSGNEMDRVEIATPKGASIRDTEGDVPALAFGFDMIAEGVEITNGNVYVSGTGSLKLYKYAEVVGTLKRFGAVVTNNAAVGADTDAFKLESVNGGNVIDINAKYLMSLESNSLSFAVRIINIPDAKLGVEIYARPYYVYEVDGEEVIVYGTIVNNNYIAVESTRRTKRVLTIGEVDGFENGLYDVLKDADYDQVILGSYVGGTYNKNDDNGKWVSSTIDQADLMADERWQYIVVTNDADLAWANANKPADAKVLYYNKDVAVDIALANLATVLDATAQQKAHTAALTWFITLTGESLDLIEYDAAFSDTDNYQMRRAAAHAWYAPNAVSDLTETVILSGSDFQHYSGLEAGVKTLNELIGSVQNQGFGMFDGLLFGGDYTTALGADYDASNEGLNLLDDTFSPHVNFGKVYGQGNHDAAGIDRLAPYGNNDIKGAPYGVFVINEDDFNCYGAGGQQVAADLTAYCNEKLSDASWGNKPIFVLSHVPLHFNARTIKDKQGATAMYIVDALNAASEAGLNIVFLIGHNHGSGYDDYLGGGAVYIPKGESIIVTDPANYKNAPIETELKFTYMNYGYISSYGNTGSGADTSLTMCTFRIQEDGAVIITRYDANGIHNLKSAGKVAPGDRDVTEYTFDDGRVYESSRIVTATSDEPYEG